METRFEDSHGWSPSFLPSYRFERLSFSPVVAVYPSRISRVNVEKSAAARDSFRDRWPVRLANHSYRWLACRGAAHVTRRSYSRIDRGSGLPFRRPLPEARDRCTRDCEQYSARWKMIAGPVDRGSPHVHLMAGRGITSDRASLAAIKSRNLYATRGRSRGARAFSFLLSFSGWWILEDRFKESCLGEPLRFTRARARVSVPLDRLWSWTSNSPPAWYIRVHAARNSSLSATTAAPELPRDCANSIPSIFLPRALSFRRRGEMAQASTNGGRSRSSITRRGVVWFWQGFVFFSSFSFFLFFVGCLGWLMDFRFHWRVRDVFSGRRGRENLLSINFTREYRFFFFFRCARKYTLLLKRNYSWSILHLIL